MAYEIIDVHVHLTRDTAQEKIVFPKPGWPDEWYWGSPDKAISYMDRAGISKLISVNIMDTRRMVESRVNRLPKGTSEKEVQETRAKLTEEMTDRVRDFNTWLCGEYKKNPRIIPFMMIDPVLFGNKAIDELNRCIALGAKGIKVHPAICGHLPDHPNMMPVYQRLQELGLGVLSDTGGSGRASPKGGPFGEPINWEPVLSTFPRLKFIMAHFCDEYWDQRMEMARQFKDNLIFDIAGGLVDVRHPPGGHRELPAVQAARVFRRVGVERFLFGSDGPPLDPMDTAYQVAALDLTEQEKRMIFSGNAKRFLAGVV